MTTHALVIGNANYGSDKYNLINAGNDARDFSATLKRLDFIVSTVLDNAYSSYSGTSMATPHVSGVVALMKAANKALTPAQVKQILQATAMPLFPNNNNEMGAGLVDAEKAVQQAIRARVQNVDLH